MIRRLSGKSCWLDVEPVFSGRSADSIFGRQHTRSRINKLYLLAYLHTMALSFFISLFVTYTDIANRQTTNIFFGFLGSHSSDAREKKVLWPLQHADLPFLHVHWVTNKSFEISKFKFKIPRARTCELHRARSRLYKFRRASPSARLWWNLSSR